MSMAMGMSSILSAPPTYINNSGSNRVLPVIRPASLKILPQGPRSRFDPLSGNHYGSHYLKSVSPGLRPRKYIMAANGSAQPASPPPEAPSNPSSEPTGRKGWIAGLLITLLLPFLKNKWGPLLLFKDKFDTNLEKVDDTVEAVEKAAEGLEKAAEDFAEKLPNGSRLKDAVNFVEHAAEEVAKDAHLADVAIHKFKELEDQAEVYLNSRSDKASNTSEEAKININ